MRLYLPYPELLPRPRSPRLSSSQAPAAARRLFGAPPDRCCYVVCSPSSTLPGIADRALQTTLRR